jgi:hypothetical protein
MLTILCVYCCTCHLSAMCEWQMCIEVHSGQISCVQVCRGRCGVRVHWHTTVLRGVAWLCIIYACTGLSV